MLNLELPGRPKVGGPFTLTDQDGKEFTERNLLGKWSLIYFGFTNCPDICPDELDKMGAVVDLIGTLKLCWYPAEFLIIL